MTSNYQRYPDIQDALALLAGDDTDHARERNDVGFNAADVRRGHWLAGRRVLTVEQAAEAWDLLQKYRVQIWNGADIDITRTPRPLEDAALTTVNGIAARFAGNCGGCGERFQAGDAIRFVGRVRYIAGHDCGERVQAAAAAAEPEAAPKMLRVAKSGRVDYQCTTPIPASEPPTLPAHLIARAARHGEYAEAWEQRAPIGLGKARAIIGPGGTLSRTLPGYETRDPQITLADGIESALADRSHYVAEAGTGTGKSMAYLIPAIIAARVDGKRTIVSTADKALQAQIAGKDIPFLQSVMPDAGYPFRAALLKGRSNYVCNQRVAVIREQGQDATFETPEAAQMWPQFVTWLDETESGDVETAPFLLGALQQSVTTDSDGCLGQKCPFKSDCYSERAKAAAKEADITIVNHALLTRDLDLRFNSDGFMAVLPDADIVMLDEAHHLEDVATDAFGVELRAGRWARIARQVERYTTEHKAIKSRLEGDPERVPADRWVVEAQFIGAGFDRLFKVIEERFERQKDQAMRLSDESELVGPVIGLMSDFAERMIEDAPEWLTADGKNDEPEMWKKLAASVGKLASALAVVATPDDNTVRYAQMERERIALIAKPIDVSDLLRNRLFLATLKRRKRGDADEVSVDDDGVISDSGRVTVVSVSATLMAAGSFKHWAERVGLDEYRTLDVPSPFDYFNNARLYLPPATDAATFDPSRRFDAGTERQYFDALASRMWDLADAATGGTFLLFTSFKALREVRDRIEPWAARTGRMMLVQGEHTRPEMVKLHKADHAAGGRPITLGVKSFWEGVDIQGDALSLVAIDKMPFNPPSDPVWAARCEAVNKAKANEWAWWNDLAIPAAIIALKQGFGRLIRTGTDRGVVAIFDSRLVTKRYGRTVIGSLPPARQVDSIGAIRAFFAAAT